MNAPTRKEIIRAVAAVWNRHVPAITGASMSRDNLVPRQVAAWLMTDRFGYSDTQAGQVLNRERTTILNSRHAIAKRLQQNDGDLLAKINRVFVELGKPDWDRSRPSAMEEQPDDPPKRVVLAPEFDPQKFEEVHQLRRIGWSLNAICRRTGLPHHIVAKMIGVKLVEAAE